MYPYPLFWGITLYDIFFALGIFLCMLCFRLLSDRRQVPPRLQNFVLLTGLAAIVTGYGTAVVAQAVYNIPRVGKFVINEETGLTFLGGLLGGAAVFLLIYFLLGRRLFKDRAHQTSFALVADLCSCSIVLAHAFGRIGCLTAGCCGGRQTDAWYGIYMVDEGVKVVPVQLMESVFLFLLFGVLLWRILKHKKYELATYMTVYGVWRFFIEYLRGDDRGSIAFLPWLSPSQLTSILLFFGGIALFLVEWRYYRKKTESEKTV